MMRSASLLLASLVAGSAFASNPAPTPVTGALTADNHYALYVGSADASDLTLIGRNELGASGSPGAYNWSQTETWNFEIEAGQYLYVMAWDDGGQQGWIGNFTWLGGEQDSNTLDWVSAVAPGSVAAGGLLPSTAMLADYINGAAWATPGASAANGSRPWGVMAGVGDAYWIWHDTLGGTSATDGHFVMFRSATPLVTAVPEPDVYALMGLGLGMVVLAARRNGKSAVHRIG